MPTRMVSILRRSAIKIWAISAAGFLLAGVSGCGGCGGGGGGATVGNTSGLSVEPLSATLSSGQTRQFQPGFLEAIPTKVSWKVKEGDGGGTFKVIPESMVYLDALVAYTAPQTPGTYHLQVTAEYAGGGTRTATAIIEVKP